MTSLYAINFRSKKKASRDYKCVLFSLDFRLICLKIATLYNYETVLLNKRRITSLIDISSLFSKVEERALKTKAAILDGGVSPFDASGRHLKDKFVVIFYSFFIQFTASAQERQHINFSNHGQFIFRDITK